MIFTKVFLLDSAERAVKTFAQTLLALFGGDALFNVLNIDLGDSLAVAGSAAFLSVLSSVVSGQVGEKDSASLVSPPVPPVDEAV